MNSSRTHRHDHGWSRRHWNSSGVLLGWSQLCCQLTVPYTIDSTTCVAWLPAGVGHGVHTGQVAPEQTRTKIILEHTWRCLSSAKVYR